MVVCVCIFMKIKKGVSSAIQNKVLLMSHFAGDQFEVQMVVNVICLLLGYEQYSKDTKDH